MHSFKPVQKRFKSVEGQVTNYKLIFFQFQVLRKSRFAQLHDEGSPASWILLSSHDTKSGFIQRQNGFGRWIRTKPVSGIRLNEISLSLIINLR